MEEKKARIFLAERLHTHCMHDVINGVVHITMSDSDLIMFREMLSVLVAHNPDNRTLFAYQTLFKNLGLHLSWLDSMVTFNI